MSGFDPSQNYFELFRLPPCFHVEQASLEQRYRDLQRETHPDRFTTATDRERRLAVQYSAWINEAYHTLRSPVLRAQYLLSLQGMNVSPEQTMANDPAFLMHQMSLREQLMELKNQPNPEQALDDLTGKLDELISHQCAQFEASYNDRDFSAAKETVMKMQFLFKLEEDAKQLEADILDY